MLKYKTTKINFKRYTCSVLHIDTSIYKTYFKKASVFCQKKNDAGLFFNDVLGLFQTNGKT